MKIRVDLTFFDLELVATIQMAREFILPDSDEPFEDAVTQLDAEADKGHHPNTGAILVEHEVGDGSTTNVSIVMSDEMLLNVLRHRMKGHPA